MPQTLPNLENLIISTAIADQATLSTLISLASAQANGDKNEARESLRRTTFNSLKGILEQEGAPEEVKTLIKNRLNLIFDLAQKF